MPAQNLPGLVLDRAHPLSRGLVGWWPLNEGAGERVNNIAGGGAGAFAAGAATPRWEGQRVKFDGGDQIAVSDAPTITKMNALTRFAVCAWIKTSTVSGVKHICRKNDTFAFGGGWTASKCGMYVNNGASWIPSSPSTTSIDTGEVFFVLATYDARALSIAVNGRIESTNTSSLDQITTGTTANPFMIGSDTGPTYAWDGQIWGVRVWNRSLSAPEIAQLYADPLAGALAPSRAARYYTAPTADPPAVPVRPMNADRLNNRTYARIWRRGETG